MGQFVAIAGVILLGCGSLTVSAQTPAVVPENPLDERLEADILLGAARNAVQRGDLNTAIQRFQQFLKQYPDREDGRREYADALFRAGRVDEALPEYDKLLAKHPADPKLVRSLVDALLNLGDHPRAKRLLTDATKKFPDRLDFAISLALLHALDGETSEAEAIVTSSIAGHPLTDRRMQRDAAALYIQLRQPENAEAPLNELLKSDPHDAQVLALSVRQALLLGDTATAVRRAKELDEQYPGNIDLRLELASALYSANDYVESGRLFSEVVQKSPTNSTALIGCARVAMQDYRIAAADAYLQRVPESVRGRNWQMAVAERDTIVGGYARGRCILRRLLDENRDDRQAAMALADLHRAENEFVKADTRYLAEKATSGNSAAARHYAMSLYLQRRYPDAEQMCCNLLARDPKDTETNLLLTRILLKTNRPDQAVAVLHRTQPEDSRALPEYLYLNGSVAPDLQLGNARDTRPLYTLVTLSDLAMDDGQRDWAKCLLDKAAQMDPENIVVRTRLAEWHASFGVPCEACVAAKIYEELLAKEPTNQKWLLGRARANVTMRCNAQALALYQRLRCESPDQYLYARENARVVFFICGSSKGLAQYDAALCDWSGLEEEARRLRMERTAKAAHFCAPSAASETYEALLALEPYEEHLAFELGQAQGALGETTGAIHSYDHLLDVNPNHRDGQVAREGKQLERCPVVAADTRFVRERGRDGLTSIDRFGEYISYQFPREEKNEYLAFGYGRLSLAPTSGGGTTGNAITFRYQKQVDADFGPRLSCYVPMAVFIDGEVQQYDRLVSTRPVFEAGVKIHTWDDVVLKVSGTMDNVLENGESLQQDIYCGGLRTDLNYKPWNEWETDTLYEYQRYSDDNTRYAAEFRSRYQLTPDPSRFTLLTDFVYWNFAEASVFSPGPDPFENMLHPYWTPQNYIMGGVGIEWKRWISWDRFDGAQHCWVSFAAIKRWDNQDQNYMVYRGTLNWDITRCLSGYAMGEYNEGSPYRGTWAYGGLALKL
jgi:predicted Zn-dependent protease